MTVANKGGSQRCKAPMMLCTYLRHNRPIKGALVVSEQSLRAAKIPLMPIS